MRNWSHSAGMSELWDCSICHSTHAYNSSKYSEVMKGLANVTEGTPHVETFDVANLTIHEIAAARAA